MKAHATRLDSTNATCGWLQVLCPRLDASRLQAMMLDATRSTETALEGLDAKRQNPGRLHAGRLDTSRLDASSVGEPKLDARRLDTSRLDARRLDARRRNASKVDAQRPDARRLNVSKVDATTATTVTAATTAPAASRLDASTCHETGCKYMPRDRMQMHAARLDATTSAGDWGQVLCMRVGECRAILTMSAFHRDNLCIPAATRNCPPS